MIKKPLLFLFVFLCSTLAFAEEKDAVLMATESGFHGDEISIENNTDALVFGKMNGEYALKKNSIRIDYFADRLMGDDETGKKTGKNISLKQKVENFSSEIIFQADFLKEGPVKSAKIPADCLSEKAPCTIEFKGETYTVSIDHKEIADSDTVEEKYNYDLTFTSHEHSSKIKSQPHPINALYWAGDLDGDGKLDLIADGTAHYNSSIGYSLYLSSLAKEGEVFGFAGAVFAYGC